MADILKEVEAEQEKALQWKHSKKKLLVEELCQKSESACDTNAEKSIKMKFIHLKAQYVQLKNKLITRQTRFLLLQSLESEQNPSADEIDSELKATSKTLKVLKDELQDAKCRIEELADQSEEKYNQLQTVIQENDSILEKIVNKKLNYEEELASISDIDTDNLNEMKEGELEEIEFLREGVKTAQNHLLALGTECENLKSHLQTLWKQSSELKKQLDEASSLKKFVANSANQVYTEWCEKMYSLIQTLSGMKVIDMEDKHWTIECKSPGLPATEDDVSHLIINIAFKVDQLGNFKLDAAEVSESSVHIQEIVKIAVKNDDVGFLLLEIQKMWLMHYPLLLEVKKLRVRYAIDWLDKEGLIKVLYGKKMNIMCTLKIEDKYPALGGISLESVDVLPEGISLEALKLPDSRADLETWLDHLSQHLQER